MKKLFLLAVVVLMIVPLAGARDWTIHKQGKNFYKWDKYQEKWKAQKYECNKKTSGGVYDQKFHPRVSHSNYYGKSTYLFSKGKKSRDLRRFRHHGYMYS